MSAVTDKVEEMASGQWRARQEQYSAKRIICAGNSLTFGQGGTSYPTQLAALRPSDSVINVGVSGRTTPVVDAQARTEVDPYGVMTGRMNICVLWEVRNHMYVDSATPSEAEDAVSSACISLKKRGFKVIVCDTLPGGFGSGSWSASNRSAVNLALATDYRNYADALVKLSEIPELQDASNTTYFADGIHCTTAGYALVAVAVNDAVSLLYDSS